MSLLFDFTNDPSDASPEIVLKAVGASAAEKILLFNIMNGNYGVPTIIPEGCKQENGMATQLKIGFVVPEPEPEEPEPEEPPTEEPEEPSDPE